MSNLPEHVPHLSHHHDKRHILADDRSFTSSDDDIREVNTEIAMTPRCFQSFHRLFLTANLLMLITALVLIGTGAGLMGFYRIHMLDVITKEFLFVPLFMIGGGAITLFIAVFGFYADVKDNQCMLVTYAVFLTMEMLILLAAVGASVHLIFVIQTGLFDADVIPELTLYQVDPIVKYKWDTIQHEFSCCGGYGYTLGYTDWKHTVIGGAHNAVPDSCCLNQSPGCGHNVFNITDIRVVIGKIHTHGCLTTMKRRLDTHVMIILLVFAAVGGLLVLIELLMVVLSCCIASTSSDPQLEIDNDTLSSYGRSSVRSRSRNGSIRSRSNSRHRFHSQSMEIPYIDQEPSVRFGSNPVINCQDCRGCHHCGEPRPTSPVTEPL